METATAEVIFHYFPDLSESQKKQFQDIYQLYVDWNSKINVISRKDIEELYIRHVLHSLAISKVCEFKPNSEILDVGTGGGFPGIPLAILYPDINFTLVDSIGKKIRVVQQVANELGLTNVHAIHTRAENVDHRFDFIVSRAVTRIGPFYNWVKTKFRNDSNHSLKNGILYLKGGDLDEELKESKLRYKLHNLNEFFSEDFFETKKVLYVPKQ